MKRFLSFAMAAVLLMVGCAKDNDSLNAGGETVAVTFSTTLPIEVSRTVGDGSQANVLNYAIYDANGVLFANYPYENDVQVSGNKATVTLDLVKGQTYKVAFWAQNENAPYEFSRTAGTVTVTYDNNELSNDETYDAFYVLEPITVSGPAVKNVVLKRPFAQINLGATKADVEAAKALGVEIDKSMVTLTNVYQTLNLYSGVASNPTTATVAFNYNALPGNDLNVKGTDYAYIAANYILANGEADVTELTFSVKDGDNEINKDVVVPSVNYKRNFRTNILGRLLTSAVDFNIVIDGTPEGDIALGKEAELYLAMQTEGEYTLTEDLTLSKPLVIKEGVTFTLNLNGKTMSVESGNAIQNYGTLILKGDVVTRASGVSSVISKTTYGVNNSGILVVDGVKVNAIYNAGELTFNDGIIENTISGKHGIYHCGSKLTINAGQFSSTANNELIHAAVANATTINGGTFTQIGKSYLFGNGAAAIVINGGTFNGYVNDNGTNDKMRPGSAVVNGGTFNFDASAWVADGYKALQSDGKWVVVTDEVDAVASTPAELNEALENGGDIVLNADIAVKSTEVGSNGYGATGISQLNGGVIDGAGNDVSVNAWGTWDSAINTTGGTIKNVNVTGGMRGIFINHNSTNTGKVFLENVTIDGTIYTISCDQGTNQGLEATASTFNGWTSYAATLGNVLFTDCNFGEGQGYKFCRPYSPTKFVNCDFSEGYAVDPVAACEFENCTLNGVALTSSNINDLVTTPKNVTVNGEGAPVIVSDAAALTEAVKNGGNISLAGDVSLEKIDFTTQTQDVVIDGNGNTITTSSNYGVEATAGKNVTLKNAKVEITVDGDYITYAAGFKIANGDYQGQTIKLENCEIRMHNTDWAYAVTMPASVKNLNLVIDNCILEGAVALQCWGDNNTITVTNSKLICNYTTSALYTSFCAVLQAEGANRAENNTLTISGCEFSYSGVDNFNSTIYSVKDRATGANNKVTVTDCTFNGVQAY